jgi:hypothetical protein
MIFEVCDNGMKVTKDAVRAVHLGSQQEESIIHWTRDTESKELALITAKARDAVTTFLNVDYMTKVIEEASEKAGVPLKGAPDQAIRTVAKKLAFSEETTAGVLDAFIRGGQVTAGGVFQAVTAFAGQVKDADLAADLEGDAFLLRGPATPHHDADGRCDSGDEHRHVQDLLITSGHCILHLPMAATVRRGWSRMSKELSPTEGSK